jgi:hypothetical protein
MRAGRAVCAVACGIAPPFALGAVVLVATAATLAGSLRPTTVTGCAEPTAPAARIDDWIAMTVPESPLRGTGTQMVVATRTTGLDPRLLAAIALQETRLGTRGGGPAVHNPFGLGPGMAFPDWAASMRTAAATLARMRAVGAGTIAQIGAHWAPVGARNDPGGLNAGWVGGVQAAYASLGGRPDGPVFGRRVTPPCPSVVAPRSS